MKFRILLEHSTTYQYLGAFVANLITVSFGISEGWPSPSIFLLTSDESPLPSGKITMEEASWIASLLCLGCLCGNIVFGYVTNRFGRRWPLILISILTILSWMFILFAQNVYYLYAGRLLIGFFGGGSYTIVPLFLNEISQDHVRGILGSTLVLTENSGLLIAFILGAFCGFHITPIVVMTLLAVFAILIYFFFPETPMFLLKQNKIDEAVKSLQFYRNMRGKDKNDKVIQLEMNKLRSAINAENSERSDENVFKWSNLKTKTARKAFTIGIVLVSLNQFSGVATMLNYTANIFEEAGSSLSPNVSTIIVGVIQVIGALTASLLVDRAGRKFLFSFSLIGTMLGLMVLGIYMMLKTLDYSVEAFRWLPIVSFSFTILIANFALLTIPVLVISEIMPETVKDFGLSFCMTLLWFFAFVTTKFLPSLNETLGLHGSLFLFAGVCLAGAVFIIVFVPETKGKSHEDIMNSLR